MTNSKPVPLAIKIANNEDGLEFGTVMVRLKDGPPSSTQEVEERLKNVLGFEVWTDSCRWRKNPENKWELIRGWRNKTCPAKLARI